MRVLYVRRDRFDDGVATSSDKPSLVDLPWHSARRASSGQDETKETSLLVGGKQTKCNPFQHPASGLVVELLPYTTMARRAFRRISNHLESSNRSKAWYGGRAQTSQDRRQCHVITENHTLDAYDNTVFL